MRISRRGALSLAAGGAVLLSGCAQSSQKIKIGFIVKQPEEPWFQSEWKWADKAAQQYNFELIKIGAVDGDKVLTAIDNLAAKGAKGFIICTPDPKLGAAILSRAKANGLKLMSVDDRLIGADGEPIAEVPHVGISATNIGIMVGETIAAQARTRGWDLKEVGLLRIAFDSLQTARERTYGARDALLKDGLDAAHVFDAPQRTTDTEGGFNAANPALTKQGTIKRWAFVGINDETVLGGVRASEGIGLGVNDVIAVGIGGSGTAQAEFSKAQPTGFFATILLSPKRHGFATSEAMYKWITENVQPALLTYTNGTVMDRTNFKALLAEQEA
jgi:L-arabinose transport system substrate-binding protein